MLINIGVTWAQAQAVVAQFGQPQTVIYVKSAGDVVQAGFIFHPVYSVMSISDTPSEGTFTGVFPDALEVEGISSLAY